MTRSRHVQDRDVGLLLGGALLVLAVLRPDITPGTAALPRISAPGGLPVTFPKADADTATPDVAPSSSAPAGTPLADAAPTDATSTVTAPTDAAQAAPIRGIDVSHYQGSVDWPTVADAGVVFAYAKATEGVTYVDPRFAANAAAAPAAGVHFGAYHFFVPTDDASAQAAHFLSVAAPKSGSLPPVLDLEKTAGGSDTLAQDAATWLAHVRDKTGCTPLVYASPAFYDAHLGDALSDYPLYLADYATSPRVPTGAGPLVLWQHSQKGTVSGVPGHVDLDLYEAGSVPMESFLCP